MGRSVNHSQVTHESLCRKFLACDMKLIFFRNSTKLIIFFKKRLYLRKLEQFVKKFKTFGGRGVTRMEGEASTSRLKHLGMSQDCMEFDISGFHRWEGQWGTKDWKNRTFAWGTSPKHQKPWLQIQPKAPKALTPSLLDD